MGPSCSSESRLPLLGLPERSMEFRDPIALAEQLGNLLPLRFPDPLRYPSLQPVGPGPETGARSWIQSRNSTSLITSQAFLSPKLLWVVSRSLPSRPRCSEGFTSDTTLAKAALLAFRLKRPAFWALSMP